MSNIRTMEFKGIDSWDRPVYKCMENGILYKDVTLGSENPELCSCSNDFEGEPDCPIKSSLELHFVGMEDQPSIDEKFNYQLLGRLESDCKYYLGFGNKNVKNLWAGNELDQINKMKELHNTFPEDKKPEWLTWEQILEYEKLLIGGLK